MRKLLALVQPAARLAAQQLGLKDASLEPLKGDVPVVQVDFPHTERLPIYITNAGAQILCICYLFQESEVKTKSRVALLETLLDLNPSVPLSNFARMGEHFVLLGAISPSCSADDLALEISTLSDNANDALSALAPFLKVTS